MHTDSDQPARLDVEGDDERQARLGRLLQRTNATSTASSHAPPQPGPSHPSSSFDFGMRQTHALGPPTELLDRLQHFLPQMEASNAELLRRAHAHPESVDIEHLSPAGEGTYIEMNLGLGVFDIRRPASEAARAGRHVTRRGQSDDTTDSASASSSGSESDSSDGDSDSDSFDASDSAIHGEDEDQYSTLIANFLTSTTTDTEPTQRPIRPLPKRARPNIVVLGEAAHADAPAHENADHS